MSRPALPGLGGVPGAGRCLVMGVLNITPDSFSDGGRYLSVDAALAHGAQLRADGADLLDVGGESTRPGAARVGAAEELRRVLPVVQGLAAAGAAVSIDTTRASVAAAAVAAGAVLINDVSGAAEPDLLAVAARTGVGYVLMHARGPSADMATRARYGDVVADVRRELATGYRRVLAAGVPAEQVVLDPGLGFAKDPEHNWALLAALASLGLDERPLLVGASRKSFLGTLLADPHGTPRPAAGRDVATAALTARVADVAWAVRVHEVAGSADAVRVAAALRAAGRGAAAAPTGPRAHPAGAVGS